MVARRQLRVGQFELRPDLLRVLQEAVPVEVECAEQQVDLGGRHGTAVAPQRLPYQLSEFRSLHGSCHDATESQMRNERKLTLACVYYRTSSLGGVRLNSSCGVMPNPDVELQS